MYKKTLVVLISILVFSCNYTDKSKRVKKTNHLEKKSNKIKERYIDSLLLEKYLTKALKLAKNNIYSNKYYNEYTSTTDSLYNVTTKVLIDNLFEDNKKNVLIKRERTWDEIIDIYKVDTNFNLVQIKHKVQSNMTYVNDSIYDINGDGYKDYVLKWYPNSGCCLANTYDVSLYNKKNTNLNKEIEFINPTFFVKEKIIRGFTYGQPNDVDLYKYRWNKYKIDTIEYIMHNYNNKNEFIRSKKEKYSATEKDGQILKKIPKEYYKIKDFAWVIGKY